MGRKRKSSFVRKIPFYSVLFVIVVGFIIITLYDSIDDIIKQYLTTEQIILYSVISLIILGIFGYWDEIWSLNWGQLGGK